MPFSNQQLRSGEVCSECPHAIQATHSPQSSAIPHFKEGKQIAFLMNNRAIAEAYSMAFEMRGHRTMTMESHQIDQMIERDQLSISLFVIDPEAVSPKFGQLFAYLRLRKIPAIFLTSVVKPAHIVLALKHQIKGVACSQSSLTTLITRISQVMSGELAEYWCTQAEEQIDWNGKQKKLKAKSVYSLLTPRQLEVLTYLAEGKTVKEVAQVMHLSQKSIDSHKYRIMNRLHIHDRVHLSRLAIREGLINP